MSLRTKCPHCDREAVLAAEAAGKNVRCKGCSKTFLVKPAGKNGSDPELRAAVRAGTPNAGPARARPGDDHPDGDPRSGRGHPRPDPVLRVGLASIGGVTLLASILVAFLIVNRHPTRSAPPAPHVAKIPAEPPPPPLAKGPPPKVEPQPKVEPPRPEPVARIDPSPEISPTAQPNAWEQRVKLAKVHADQSQWDEAAAEYTKAIDLKPDAWEPWSGRAFVHFHRKEWDDAVADFSRAIDLAPKVHANLWHRGHAYLNLAQWDKAAADFGTVVDQWPDGSEGWYLRAVAMAQLQQPDKALADLRQAIAKGFHNLQWLKDDSRLAPLRTREDFDKLVEELERKQKSKSQ